MSLIEIASIIVPSLFGGGILTYLIQKRRENRDDFKALLEAYKADNARLRELERENAQKIEELNHKCIKFEKRIQELTMMVEKLKDKEK